MGEAGGGLYYPDSADEDADWDTVMEMRAEERWADEHQSTTACCPRQTIPDSCSCQEGCGCACLDCICEGWGDEELY